MHLIIRVAGLEHATLAVAERGGIQAILVIGGR
jgi:hypothetical protein